MNEKIIEVVSVYFSNVHFNTLYEQARDYFNDERYPSIEQAYRTTVESFNNAFKQTKAIHGKINEHYPTVMNTIATHCNKYLSTTYTYSRFIDVLAQSILPQDIYSDVSNESTTKADIVRQIMVKTVSNFTSYILTDQFAQALDLELRNSNNPERLKAVGLEWKLKFKDLFMKQIKDYCDILITKRNGGNINPTDGQPDMVPAAKIKELEQKMREILTAKNQVIVDRNKIANYARLLINRVKELESMLEENEPINPVISPRLRKSTDAPTSGSDSDGGSSTPRKQPRVTVSSDALPTRSHSAPVLDISVLKVKPTQSPSVKISPKFAPDQLPSDASEVHKLATMKYDGVDLPPELMRKVYNVSDMEEITDDTQADEVADVDQVIANDHVEVQPDQTLNDEDDFVADD